MNTATPVNTDIFTHVASFDVEHNKLKFPSMVTHPEFDEMDGVHAIDIERDAQKSVDFLRENQLRVSLFKLTDKAPDYFIEEAWEFCKLYDKYVAPRDSMMYYLFPHLWEKLDEINLSPKLLVLPGECGFSWSDREAFYAPSYTIKYSEMEINYVVMLKWMNSPLGSMPHPHDRFPKGEKDILFVLIEKY